MFFLFIFLEKTVRGEPSLQPLLPLGFLSCLFFFTCPLASIRDTCPNFLGGQTQPLRDPLGRQLLSRCAVGPGNTRCTSRKGCGHMFGKCFILHSLLGSSSALWGVKSTKKSFKEDTCFVFNLGFPQIISLLDSPPHPHKNS